MCLLATSGYFTSEFLCKHEEFISRKDRPQKNVSDRGSQFVRAAIVIAEKEKWEEAVRKNSAFNWVFVPVGSQHSNGVPESLVKVLKKSLHHAIAPEMFLKYSALPTFLAEISHSINSTNWSQLQFSG